MITDLHLGAGQQGTDVIRSMRSALGLRIRVVLITGDTSTAVAEIARDNDVRIVSKPIDAERLLGLVSSMTATAA